jgi:hypothetical protein
MERFDRLRWAQALLYDQDAPPETQHRTVWCHRTMAGDRAALWRSADAARLAGVTTCGSGWACPVCASRIAEPRREELTRALGAWAQAGRWSVSPELEQHSAALLTVTFPHQAADDRIEGGDNRPAARLAREVEQLRDRLEKFARALASWKSLRAYKSAMAGVERAGSIRALEVTVGDAHGWHPHTHDVVFTRRPLAMFKLEAWHAAARELGLDPDNFRHWHQIAAGLRDDPQRFERSITPEYRALRDSWIGACLRAGLASSSDVEHMRLHAIDLRDGRYAAEYIAKYGREADGWSIASEVTRSSSKLGRLTDRDSHYSPMQLLAAAAEGDSWAGFRYRAFVAAFTGRRMLTWSRGLRATLARFDAELAKDFTDEELAARERPLPDEQYAGSLTAEQLRAVTARGWLGELLAFVALTQADQAGIDGYVADLVETIPPRWGDTLRRRRTYGAGHALIDS